ncbi:MAG: hypothetical protein ACR2K2_12540 [Mycobacteriales bacterium]
MTSKLGTGDAKFHYGGTAGPVDTVYLGVFRREVLERLGGFDADLLRNQDYELNFRIRQDGGRRVVRPHGACPRDASRRKRPGQADHDQARRRGQHRLAGNGRQHVAGGDDRAGTGGKAPAPGPLRQQGDRSGHGQPQQRQ